ncbi:MAG: hypothetical protein ABIZ35_18600 [Capsulimonas sp.]|uniref:hypothetical protein n=1 Tax=Capsulimonas sp. TaxID=2494211 RepID=UPI003266F4CC
MAFVAEGAPLAPKLTGAAIPDLKTEAPLDEVVSKIAGAYDYNSQRRGDVFVLTKRYTKSQDLPCVTLKECRQAADTLSTILNTFSPKLATSVYASRPNGERDVVYSFFQSLSPAQLEAVQNKKLSYGSLSPTQQALIQKFFLFQYVQMPSLKVQDAISHLHYAHKSTVTAKDKQGYSGLFMEVPNLIGGSSLVLLPLTESQTPLNQKQPSMLRDIPTTADPNPSKATTLGSIVADLKPVKEKAPGVDEVLEDKPVTVAGIDNVDSMSILDALSVLYRLDLLQATTWEKARLKPHHINAPRSLKEMDTAIWAAIPVSYLRALHMDGDAPSPDKSSVNAAKPTDDGQPNSDAVATPDIQALMHAQELPTQIKQAANNYLLLAIQPQLKNEGLAARIPVSTLDNSAQAALGLSLMTDLIRTLQLGFSGFPHQNVLNCLDNMDETIIYSTPGEEARINNQNIPSIYLEGTDPTTKEHVGLGGVRYFGHH